MPEIEVQDAAHGYVEMFHRLGIDYVFGSPGSEFVPLWEHLARYNSEDKKPFYINLRHEGIALSMAKGYYMATGKAQTVITHVVTGLLHGAMELKAAYTDQIPLLLIVGQNRTHDGDIYGGTPGPHYLSFTEVGGQERLVNPYVKWGDSPETNANILSAIQRAYTIASADVKGPVLLNLSRELLFEKTSRMMLPVKFNPPEPLTCDNSAIKKLRDLLLQSENPMIYTRYLGRNEKSFDELVRLAELTGTPVFETPGYTNFPTDNPLHMGNNLGPYIKDTDLILVIDSSSWPPWYPPSSIRDQASTRIVFIDPDPLQLKYPVYGYPSDLTIKADSQIAVKQLNELLETANRDDEAIKIRKKLWAEEHRRIREGNKIEALATKDKIPIDPKWLCYCINQVIDENTIIVNETITHGNIIHKMIESNRTRPGTRYESIGPVAHTGLGQGLGIALGVKLAKSDRKVMTLIGDGTFNYNPVPAAFGASQEYNLPIMTIIFNNQCYAAMRGHQRYYPDGYSVRHNQYYGVACPSPEYSSLIEAYNGYGETVSEPSEVKPALRRAIDAHEEGRSSLLDVKLSQ
jgi:acetolactate synthase-1/2/3 large subunit